MRLKAVGFQLVSSLLHLRQDEDGDGSGPSVINWGVCLRPPPIDKLLQSMHQDQGVLHRLCQAWRSLITGKHPSHAEH